MDPMINEIVEAVSQAYTQAGWWAVMATVAMFGIRIFRLDFIQASLMPKARWAAWPTWAKLAAPFGLAFLGALILSVIGGVGWQTAVVGAIGAALMSIGGHHTTKAIGTIQATRALAKGIEPPKVDTVARAARSLVVPYVRMLQGGPPPPGDPDEKDPAW